MSTGAVQEVSGWIEREESSKELARLDEDEVEIERSERGRCGGKCSRRVEEVALSGWGARGEAGEARPDASEVPHGWSYY